MVVFTVEQRLAKLEMMISREIESRSSVREGLSPPAGSADARKDGLLQLLHQTAAEASAVSVVTVVTALCARVTHVTHVTHATPTAGH